MQTAAIYEPRETTDTPGQSRPSPTLNRSTNVSPVTRQIGGTCYAHAAVSAYINTAERIFGHPPLPPFADMLRVAIYSTTGVRTQRRFLPV
jgi:hypothetical protein